jgi:hypothetical protein
VDVVAITTTFVQEFQDAAITKFHASPVGKYLPIMPVLSQELSVAEGWVFYVPMHAWLSILIRLHGTAQFWEKQSMMLSKAVLVISTDDLTSSECKSVGGLWSHGRSSYSPRAIRLPPFSEERERFLILKYIQGDPCKFFNCKPNPNGWHDTAT